MLKEQLLALKDFVLLHNTYFDEGFEFADMNYAGIISADNQEIFPNDTLGNYFYFRVPDKVTFDSSAFYQTSECKKGTGLVTSLIMVAAVRGADADKLLQNLVNTLVAYTNPKINLQSLMYHSESVLIQELARVPKDDLQAALQRLDTDYTLVCVQFNFTVAMNYYKNLTCIINPCAEC